MREYDGQTPAQILEYWFDHNSASYSDPSSRLFVATMPNREAVAYFIETGRVPSAALEHGEGQGVEREPHGLEKEQGREPTPDQVRSMSALSLGSNMLDNIRARDIEAQREALRAIQNELAGRSPLQAAELAIEQERRLFQGLVERGVDPQEIAQLQKRSPLTTIFGNQGISGQAAAIIRQQGRDPHAPEQAQEMDQARMHIMTQLLTPAVNQEVKLIAERGLVPATDPEQQRTQDLAQYRASIMEISELVARSIPNPQEQIRTIHERADDLMASDRALTRGHALALAELEIVRAADDRVGRDIANMGKGKTQERDSPSRGIGPDRGL